MVTNFTNKNSRKFVEHLCIFAKRGRQGQALIESIVAISILVVGFLGMFALLTRSIFLNRIVSDNYIGTYLAAEGVEIIKNIIDANILNGREWDDGLNCGSSICNYEVEYNTCSSSGPCSLPSFSSLRLSFDPLTGFYSYSGTVPTNFVRQIRIMFNFDADLGADAVRVNSIVTWTTGLAQASANLEDVFTNWRP